ncbi:tail fiber protein [Synechococcus phage S-CAM7]|uniref:Tail fiber protein n=1 Tax=Synechococcus phage S-CAM7 TaxID=1883368 RepID=A0A1D8KTQ4_9CAUD|nr:tail fiber protein [Synechococcus phage S-CAM7]AOV62046.1 hypothetical protein C490910_122 [Synechococcus phage S-CAM7]AOV62309.1 hypothetical protein S420910_120 [Synechococcus phage S-CAM7]
MAVNISGNGAIEGITSFNGGGLTFRNILYNGWVNTSNEINQRGKTISEVSDGDYWADRWQRVSSTTMTQKVEEGNYIPNRTYTLSGNNVTTVQVTSPASGTWNWGTVPSNASLVQLELGDTPSAFEYRPKGLELGLCQRYYQNLNVRMLLDQVNYLFSSRNSYVNPMRTAPSVGFTGKLKWDDLITGQLSSSGFDSDNVNVSSKVIRATQFYVYVALSGVQPNVFKRYQFEEAISLDAEL